MACRVSAIRFRPPGQAAAVFAAAAVLTFSAGLAAAHPDISEAEDAVAHAIEETPDDPKLYLHRGTLERKRGDWDAAAASYTKAAELGADRNFTDVALAVVFAEAGLHKTALTRVNIALERDPESAVAIFTRARLYRDMSQPAAAAAEYVRAITALNRPDPGVVLEAMDAQLVVPVEDAVASEGTMAADGDALSAQAAQQQRLDAIAVADVAISKLGPIPSIQTRAVELETELKRYDAAVNRMDTLLAAAPRHEIWIARKGDLLIAADRPDEAVEAYRHALALLAERPQARRSSKLQSLEQELREKLQADPHQDKGETP